MSNDDNCEDARDLLSISSSNYRDDDESYDSSSDTDSFSLISTSDDSQASQDLSTQSNRVAAGDLLPHSYSSDDLNSDLDDDEEEDGINDEVTTITLTNMPTDNGINKTNSTSKEEGEGQDDSSSILEMQIFDVLHLTEKEQELDDSAGTYNNLIRIATFNVMNGYTAEAAVQIATSLRLNYVAFQETGSSINENTKSFIESGTSYTRRYAYEPTYTDYQAALVDQETLVYAQQRKEAKVLCGGRVLIQRFNLNDANINPLTIISCYCVSNPTGTDMLEIDGLTRRERANVVHQEIEKSVADTIRRFPNGILVLMGDLQEEFDGPFLRRLRNMGLKSPIMEQMTHPDWPDRYKTKGPPTRFPIGNMPGEPRAYDWILVFNANEKVTKIGIDYAPVTTTIASDHLLVFIELSVTPKRNRIDTKPFIKFNYGRISGIKVKHTILEDGTRDYLFDDSQFETPQIKESHELFDKTRYKATHDELCTNKLLTAQAKIEFLKRALIQHARECNYDRQAGELPPRRKDLCDKLEQASHSLADAVETLMDELKLTRTTNLRREVYLKWKKIIDGIGLLERDEEHSPQCKIGSAIKALKTTAIAIRRQEDYYDKKGLFIGQDLPEAFASGERQLRAIYDLVGKIFEQQELRRTNEEAIEVH